MGYDFLFCILSNVQEPNSFKTDGLVYFIKDTKNELVVNAPQNISNPQLVCSRDNRFQEYWNKLQNGDNFLIATASSTASSCGKLRVISCTMEGESGNKNHYLWKKEGEYIVSARHGLVIGVQDSEIGASLILCRKEELKPKLKLIS